MFAKFANKERVSQLVGRGAMLVDMRSPVAFRNGSIDGSVNLPLKSFLNQLAGLDKKTKLILFSDTSEDADVKTGINYAVQLGFNNLFVSEYRELNN
jgi:rhodanese-related sulfurtransferase